MKSKSKRHFLVNLVGILLLALIVTLVFFNSYNEGLKQFLISYGWALAISATQWLGNAYIYGLLDKKYSWHEHLVKRAILGSLALIGYSAFAYLIVQVLMFWVVQGGLPERPLYWALRSSYIAIAVSFIISLIFVAVGFFHKWRASLLEAERFKAEMMMYKYESLQNQINPHFLFNSFNVLSDLVYEDQDKAVDFIRQMSQLFRYVLDSRDKELVPIREELEFIEAYSSLLQTRFENKLSIHQDFEPEEDEMIVPMTLQLLIENCVKHNEISASLPLLVEITRTKDYIEVRNKLQLKAVGPDSKKTGLSNIRQQYRYFTPEDIVTTETDHIFIVAVPIIKSGDQ
jgi:two-component system LytT family sensor kinase